MQVYWLSRNAVTECITYVNLFVVNIKKDELGIMAGNGFELDIFVLLQILAHKLPDFRKSV